jgi:hypothetical protein
MAASWGLGLLFDYFKLCTSVFASAFLIGVFGYGLRFAITFRY